MIGFGQDGPFTGKFNKVRTDTLDKFNKSNTYIKAPFTAGQYSLDSRDQVLDSTELFAIPSTKRYEGMKVYVKSYQINYQLQGGITNAHWHIITSQMGAGSVTSVGSGWGVDASPNPIVTSGTVSADSSVLQTKVLTTSQLLTKLNVFDTTTKVDTRYHTSQTYEPKYASSTTDKWWRGDKSWQTLPTSFYDTTYWYRRVDGYGITGIIATNFAGDVMIPKNLYVEDTLKLNNLSGSKLLSPVQFAYVTSGIVNLPTAIKAMNGAEIDKGLTLKSLVNNSHSDSIMTIYNGVVYKAKYQPYADSAQHWYNRVNQYGHTDIINANAYGVTAAKNLYIGDTLIVNDQSGSKLLSPIKAIYGNSSKVVLPTATNFLSDIYYNNPTDAKTNKTLYWNSVTKKFTVGDTAKGATAIDTTKNPFYYSGGGIKQRLNAYNIGLGTNPDPSIKLLIQTGFPVGLQVDNNVGLNNGIASYGGDAVGGIGVTGAANIGIFGYSTSGGYGGFFRNKLYGDTLIIASKLSSSSDSVLVRSGNIVKYRMASTLTGTNYWSQGTKWTKNTLWPTDSSYGVSLKYAHIRDSVSFPHAGQIKWYANEYPASMYMGNLPGASDGLALIADAGSGLYGINGLYGSLLTSYSFLLLTPTSTPGIPTEGTIYQNSTNHHLYQHNGSTWNQLDNQSPIAGYRIGVSGSTVNNTSYRKDIDSISSSIPYTSNMAKVVMVDTTNGKLYRRKLTDAVTKAGVQSIAYDSLQSDKIRLIAATPSKLLAGTLYDSTTGHLYYMDKWKRVRLDWFYAHGITNLDSAVNGASHYVSLAGQGAPGNNQNVYYKVYSGSPTKAVVNESDSVLMRGDSAQIQIAGDYKVTFYITASTTTAADVIRCKLFVNHVKSPSSIGRFTLDNKGNSGNDIISGTSGYTWYRVGLNKGDWISFWCTNITANRAILVSDYKIIIERMNEE